MESVEKVRSNVQDMVKGALIIAVVYFHATLYGNATSYNEFNIVFCLFPCLMGVFFFYAGYNYTVGQRTVSQNIRRRAKRLLIPFAIMIVVDTVLVGGLQLLYKNTDFTGIWHALKNFLLSEGGVAWWHPDISKMNYDLALSVAILWYLYTLFIVSVIFYLVVDKVVVKLSRFIITVTVLVTLTFVIGQFVSPKLPYALQSYPLMLALMLTGAFFSYRKTMDKPLDDKKSILFAVAQIFITEGIIFGISMLCYYAFGATTVGALAGGALNEVIKGFDSFVTYIMAICGTLLVYTVMSFLNKIKVFGVVFGFIGKNVAFIYATHPIFLSFIHTIIFQRDFSVLGWFQPFAYMLITLVLFSGISLLIGFIINKKFKNKVIEINKEN